jgi:hypothetical protein
MAPPSLGPKDHWDGAPCKTSECLPPLPAPVIPMLPPPTPAASSSGSDGRAAFVTALIVAGSALAFVVLCLFLFLFVRRRRQRRREALLEAALAPGGVLDDIAEQAGGEIVHHAWHILTLGLDEAAIESIALSRYRSGAGGASDCAVCLGEFADGELLRLLPRCAHAFHVRCIDTWLRAHVNCPLCRSHVLDPSPVAGAAEQSAGSPPSTDADTREAPSSIQIGQPDGRTTSPEQPRSHPGPRVRNFRRVASMDSPSPMASAEEAVPEADKQAGGEKQGEGGADHCASLSPGCSGRRGMKRSLSVGGRWALVSRHGRRSSSLLPL